MQKISSTFAGKSVPRVQKNVKNIPTWIIVNNARKYAVNALNFVIQELLPENVVLLFLLKELT